MKVRDLMTTTVASVNRDQPLSAAAELMWHRDCGAVPVKDGDVVVGMLTDRDICMATWTKDQPPSSILVAEAMSSELYYCGADDTLSLAESLMQARRVRRLPVVDDAHRLVGILSLADIVRKSRPPAFQDTASLSSSDVALTLATICQPTNRATARESVGIASEPGSIDAPPIA